MRPSKGAFLHRLLVLDPFLFDRLLHDLLMPDLTSRVKVEMIPVLKIGGRELRVLRGQLPPLVLGGSCKVGEPLLLGLRVDDVDHWLLRPVCFLLTLSLHNAVSISLLNVLE